MRFLRLKAIRFSYKMTNLYVKFNSVLINWMINLKQIRKNFFLFLDLVYKNDWKI